MSLAPLIIVALTIIMVIARFWPEIRGVFSKPPLEPESPEPPAQDQAKSQTETPKKKSWETVKGLAIAAIVVIALVFLVILPSYSSLIKTKLVSYYPNADTQTICIGKGNQKIHFKVAKTYYEIPKLGRTLKNRLPVSTLGEWTNPETKKLLPVKWRKYGEVLANNQPSNSVTRLDSDGCLKVKLNLPKVAKTIKGRKTILQFTKL